MPRIKKQIVSTELTEDPTQNLEVKNNVVSINQRIQPTESSRDWSEIDSFLSNIVTFN